MICPGEYLTPTIGGNKSWAKSDAAQISKREYSKHTHTPQRATQSGRGLVGDPPNKAN